MQVTTLSEKAMLVKLTTKRANLSRRDADAEAIIQQQLDDASLVVLSRLFRDNNNPVKKVLSALDEAYAYHRNHTLPYTDKGPRILPNSLYMDYTTAMRDKRTNLDQLRAQVLPNYDKYVQLDIQSRSAIAIAQGKTPRAKIEDYPTAEEFDTRVGFELRFMPLPDRKHFLFDLSDEDVQNFTQAMHDAEVAAKNDAVTRMIRPLKHLVEKLDKPIGTDGSIFRDSAIENVIEGVELAKKLLIDPPREMLDTIDELTQTVSKYHSAWLRESPIVREQAAKKLDDIARQMGAFMGV